MNTFGMLILNIGFNLGCFALGVIAGVITMKRTYAKGTLIIKPPFVNPNKDRIDMDQSVINGGFRMFRNPDTYWNTYEKVEKWHGPMICHGVDFNNLVYHTQCGEYTMVRELTEEEMERFATEIDKTDGLVEKLI